MIRGLLLMVMMAIRFCIWGQPLDTLRLGSTQVAADGRSAADSLSHIAGETSDRMDSLLRASMHRRKVDSLTVLIWGNNLKEKIQQQFSEQRITRLGDSLRSVGIPSPSIDEYADSLKSCSNNMVGLVANRQDELHRRLTLRYNRWASSARKFSYDTVSGTISDSARLKIPSMAQPNLVTPEIAGFSELTDIPTLVPTDFEDLDIPMEVIRIGGPEALPNFEQLSDWDSGLGELSVPELAVPSTIRQLGTDPGGAIEAAALQNAEVQTVTQEMEAGRAAALPPISPEEIRAIGSPGELEKLGGDVAVDHLAGRQNELNGAMTQMGMYKKKYSSLGSLADVKMNSWLPVNGLKGKPFKERFRVGLNIGAKSSGDTVLIDIYPNASYRVTGRIEAGLSLFYRLRMAAATFDQQRPVWGVSSFAVVRTFKSLFVRLELEASNWPSASAQQEAPQRDWRWNPYAGLQSSFKIGKRWIGLVQMMYGFDQSLKDVFPERLSARAGIQYKLTR